MTPIQDYFTVAIDCRYEEAKTKSGIILINTAWIDDDEGDRFQHKRIYGTVLSVPETYSDTPYRAIDDGMPAYHKFIGHDDIVDKINRGYRNHAEKSYYPSTFDKYDVVTVADIAKRVDVKVRDKVYFTPQVTEPGNLLPDKHNGKEVYRINVTEIFAAVRADVKEGAGGLVLCDKIWMQGEWVLVKPNMETWDEITTKMGIIKKPRPESKWLEAIIAHSSHKHLVPGMKVAYLPNSDWDLTVEGEKYFLMTAQDIIGKLN